MAITMIIMQALKITSVVIQCENELIIQEIVGPYLTKRANRLLTETGSRTHNHSEMCSVC